MALAFTRQGSGLNKEVQTKLVFILEMVYHKQNCPLGG
jgi:hypothetical protein